MRLWSVAFQPRTRSSPAPAATCKCGTGCSPLPNKVGLVPEPDRRGVTGLATSVVSLGNKSAYIGVFCFILFFLVILTFLGVHTDIWRGLWVW